MGRTSGTILTPRIIVQVFVIIQYAGKVPYTVAPFLPSSHEGRVNREVEEVEEF
jgi:hypothetical protein